MKKFLLKLKNKFTSKNIYTVLLISFLLHFFIVMFIQYAHFRPFGGGADFEGYNFYATKIANNFRSGNYSLDGLRYGHDFPLVVGIIYFLTIPNIIVGLLFICILFVLSIYLIYRIIIELGGSEKTAFIAALCANFYPSYGYFGSLLLKDTLIIPLILLSVLLIIKMTKKFSFYYFILFCVLCMAVDYLRFYMAYALICAFIFSWFLSCNFQIKKLAFGVILIALIGVVPLSVGDGYFGYYVMQEFLNPGKITMYREMAYNPDSPRNETINPIFEEDGIPDQDTSSLPKSDVIPSGMGSSFVVETGFKHGPIKFVQNSILSAAYCLFGPFIWQFRYARHYSSLVELIPWYLIILVFLFGIYKEVKEKSITRVKELFYKTAPLWSFAIFAIGALSMFINNYGIIARIRIPALILLSLTIALFFDKNITLFYEKIFSNWRSRFYRV